MFCYGVGTLNKVQGKHGFMKHRPNTVIDFCNNIFVYAVYVIETYTSRRLRY
jgi:hypothetical protein